MCEIIYEDVEPNENMKNNKKVLKKCYEEEKFNKL